MPVLILDHIDRKLVRQNPDWIFLFGDNLQQKGYGGQAGEMRGEPNAVGIPTKKRPSMKPGAFFTDAEYDDNVAAIDAAFDRIPADAGMIVLPRAGLGSGKALLARKAPGTHSYLQRQIDERIY